MASVEGKFRISIDAGGTFTDVAMLDPTERLSFVKVPSTPDRPALAVFNALNKAAALHGLDPEQLMGSLHSLVLGTTVATNMLVEHRGSPTGLICTRGFRDTLAIRRGLRRSVWDFRSPHPPELVPRALRVGVPERIAADGTVVLALDEAAAVSAARRLRAEGVESIAICLFNAFVNEAHEQELKAIVQRELPEAFVSVSSELLPIMGEYERTSTTVVNAYIGPKTSRHLTEVDQELRQRGMRGTTWVMQNSGGIVSIEACARRPVGAALSGPAAGAAAASLYTRCLDVPNVVLFDMGGTSTDITLTRDGRPTLVDCLEIEGYHIALPSVGIKTIGTGGGTVAWVGPGGLLRVGPRGVGADPGPAAYGKGGTEPTITDANLVLGRLNPDNFLGGEVRLDPARSREVIERRICRATGLDLERAAGAIVRIGNQNMINAIRLAAVELGQDLRKFALVAAGGAAGLHASALARELRIPRVYIPREAAVCCAVGMLQTDVRHDYEQTYFCPLAAVTVDDLNRRFRAMLTEADGELRAGGIGSPDIVFETSVELRYSLQQWQLGVPVKVPLSEVDLGEVSRRFHLRHEELYGHHDPNGTLELVKLRVVGIGISPKMSQAPMRVATLRRPPPDRTRTVHLRNGAEALTMPIYEGPRLAPGDVVEGPALIEEPTTTVLLQAGDTLRVDGYDNYLWELAG